MKPQNTRDIKNGYIWHSTLKSQFLLVKFYLSSARFCFERDSFSLVFPTYAQFLTQIVVLFKSLFNGFFLFNQKLCLHAFQKSDKNTLFVLEWLISMIEYGSNMYWSTIKGHVLIIISMIELQLNLLHFIRIYCLLVVEQ